MSLLVNVHSKKEELFLTELLKKLGYEPHILTEEEQEDAGLYLSMKKSERGEIYQFAEAKAEYKRQKKQKRK